MTPLRTAFARQAESCAALGSPFMARLFGVLIVCWPDGSRLDERLAAFSGDIGPAGASLPLRIAGGLHALVLSGRAPDLAALYPPAEVSDGALQRGVVDALERHEPFLIDWVESPPQTNEVRRSAALIAGAAVLRARHELPVFLSELGASGGLNLMWDRFALDLPGARIGPEAPALALRPDWQGPLPPLLAPQVAARAGVDLNPLDPANPAHMLRLMAFLWPDQPERLALTRAAAGVMHAGVARGDALPWLETRLAAAPAGHVHLIQHTIAWQYFPKETQARGRAAIEDAGKAASADRPLAWLSMESDGTDAPGAALTLRLWPGDVTLDLGRADYHGRWIRWAGRS